MTRHSIEDTIAAVSTSIGEGAIGIVRLSGPKSLGIADKIFASQDGKKPSEFETYTTHYGHIVGSRVKGVGCREKVNKIVDEVILTVMKAPRSYTKEDVVEINCHGGIEAVKEVFDLVILHGARTAEPGEFTKRAFLNGRIDLSQAEAVLDMIRAKTESSMKAAMNQLEGELSEKINGIRDMCLDIASQVEASIDFPEEELDIAWQGVIKKAENIAADLRSLIETSDEGIVLREGVLAVICGKPNSGKSSLMNLLLKRDRVIVTPIPGTTRDAVEETINLKGIPIRLVDTAGIADTKDAIEREGIRRSKRYLGFADIALLVLDASTKIDDEDRGIIDMIKDKNKVIIVNKTDLPRKIDVNALKGIFKEDSIVEISVKKKRHIEHMEEAITKTVWKGDMHKAESLVVTNARHKALLQKALRNIMSVRKSLKGRTSAELISIDLKEAIFNLGLIVGKSVSEDILDRIFGEFCIGK